MNLARTVLLIVTAAAGISLPARGDTFRGEISVHLGVASTIAYDSEGNATVTSEITGMSVGDIFSGWYEYDSPTADFNCFGSVHVLRGAINLPSILFTGVEGPMRNLDIDGWGPIGLEIVGGEVTRFDWTPDLSGADANFFYSTWNLGSTGRRGPPPGAKYSAGGTISFGAPVTSGDPVVSVPDSGQTLWLLVGAVFGLLSLRAAVGAGRMRAPSR